MNPLASLTGSIWEKPWTFGPEPAPPCRTITSGRGAPAPAGGTCSRYSRLLPATRRVRLRSPGLRAVQSVLASRLSGGGGGPGVGVEGGRQERTCRERADEELPKSHASLHGGRSAPRAGRP